ncbi:MAG: helicase-related protein [Bacteroidia bacterium]|nr:helicase-related protein [Bacteroidia bacterium]
MSSKFFTNETDNSLFKKFVGAFENIANLYAFHAVVGYFRASGYFAIREHLKKLEEVKILVGINVDIISAEAKRRGMMFFGDPERSRDEFVRWIRADIREAAYSKEVEDGIIQFFEDIIDGKIQIRVHRSKTLHAKIYIFLPGGFNEYTGGEVITGSSNLTSNGLGTKEEANYEFNVALRDYEDVKFAEDEFIKLWEQGEELLAVDLERIKKGSHIGQLFTPFELYIKLLIEYFGKHIDYDPDSVGDLPQIFKKLSYQIDAVNQGYQMILNHNGFMLADVVGLGKTVIATMIAKRFLIANGSLSTKILVVYPPAVEKNWKTTFRHFGIDKHARFISNGSLHKILKDDKDYWPKEDYDLILVDESHKYRNHTSQMFQQLQLICKAQRAVEGDVIGDRKKVILISATPLNNRPADIYHQLLLFQDARKSNLPVTNLQAFFAPLIKEYKDVLAESRFTGRPDINKLRKIYSQIRDKVLEPITVRRTRRDVKNYPEYLKDIKDQKIVFPDIAEPKAVRYDMDEELNALFYKTINYLVSGEQIGFYRYQAISALLPEVQERCGYSNAERAAKSLAHIMMTQLVKRLESSFYAFRKSIDRQVISIQRMIEMFAKGKIYIAPDLSVNELMDKDWSDDDIEERILELSAENPKNNIFAPSDFQEGFLDSLKSDLASFTELALLWKTIDRDPKFEAFIKLFTNELLRPDKNPSGKLVIFSESKETINYLNQRLIDLGITKILEVSSENRSLIFDLVQRNFDANLPGEFAHDYDYLLTTEVLAEGVNLHRANIIVNYDTPWNATRLMQRLGRVNRIGSTAELVFSYSFYPSHQSDDLINLYNNAYVKLQGFHTAYGEDAKIYTTEEVLEQVKLHIAGSTEEEDKRLIYLRFIREFKASNEKDFKRIAKLPMKARTGRSIAASQKENMKGNSLVFLKSPYKLEFYKVFANKKIEPLTFIQAAEIFEAKYNEASCELPDYHHSHVHFAENHFEQELLATFSDSLSGSGSDAGTNQSKKFVRERRAESTDDKFRESATALIELLDFGTISVLPMELKKLKAKFDKNQLNKHQTENLIMAMAIKYTNANREDETSADELSSELPLEITQKPDIIISETFTS